MFGRRSGGGAAAGAGAGAGTESGRAAEGCGAFACTGPPDTLAGGLVAAAVAATCATGGVVGAGFAATGLAGCGAFVADWTAVLLPCGGFA
jgi:hypothetical protein